MADEKTFTLVGNFKDNITPSLRKLNTQLAATTKSFEKMQKMVRPIAKDMAIMGDAASRMTQGMGGQRNVFESNLRAMKDYRSELGRISAAQRQMERKFKVPAAPFAPASIPRGDGGGGGGGPRTVAPSQGALGDGYTIDKAVLAGLATNFVTGLFNQITNVVGKSINFVKGAIQERIDDEMGDIQSAGGILSIGKEKKVPWADTYQEAFAIQKRLNGEMANLAAALPGETGQYVANMKQVTDTVMKVTTSNGPAMIKAMQGYNSAVKTNQDAYVEATKQLAKFTTLASLGQEGGVPLTALAEQMLNADKVNIKSLKTTYAALQKNPLVSGALEKYEKEMNKAAAGSAERYTAMLKAFEQAFPVEVLDAMTNSADGIIQGLKSGLLNPDTGLLGLGRAFEVDFTGLNRKMGPMKENLAVFDVFLGLFKAFGMVLSPIVAELPKIIEPFKSLMDPLKGFYVAAENTISNFKAATKKFGDLKLSFPAFRGSLEAIGKLAKSMGANEGEFQKLQGMLGQKNLNLGAALQQAVKTLMSSEFFEKIGKAFGESLSGFLSMLAGLAGKGGELADESGFIKGFMDGWKKNNGTQAIMGLIKNIMGAIVKGLGAAALAIIASDPVDAAILATVFIGPVRGVVFKLLGMLATKIGAAIMASSLAGTVTATIAGWAGAIVPALASIGTTIGATVAGWAGAIVPAISAIGTGLMTFFTVTLPAVLAPLLVPALIVGAIIGLIALIYVFKDQIMGAITALQGFIAKNFSGGLRDALLGATNVMKAVVQMITGLVDTVLGFFTGDKARMEKGIQSIRDGAGKWLNGMKQMIVGGFNAYNEFVRGIANSIKSGAASVLQKIQQFFAPVTNWLNEYLIQPLGLLFQAIKMRISQGVQAFPNFIQTFIVQPIQKALQFLGSAIVKGFMAYVGFYHTYVVQPVINALTFIGSAIAQGFQGLLGLIQTYVVQPHIRAFAFIGSVIAQGFNSLVGFVQTYIVAPVQSAFTAIGSALAQRFQGFLGLVQTHVIQPHIRAFVFIGSIITQGFNALVGFVQTHIVEPVQSAFTVIGSALAQGFYALVGLVQTYIIAPLLSVFAQIQAGVASAVGAIMSAWQSFVSLLIGAFRNLSTIAGQVGSTISSAVMSGVQALGNAIKGAILNAASFISGGAIKPASTPKPKGTAKYDGVGGGKTSLGSAIATEMKNKPSGSHLVIANSSETVIPAAGGYGAKDMMDTLKIGFSNSIVAYENISKGVNTNRQDMVQGFQKDAERSTQTNQKIDKYQTTTTSQITSISANVAALAAQVKQMGAMGMMGGGMGGGAGGGGGGGAGGGGMALGGGYGSRGSQIAGALGTYIKQTGGAPGSIHEHPQHGGVKGRHSPNSYHYQGRAIDIGAYANEQAGVLARVAQFNQKNGVKPVELLKAGDPGHSDHVHVAYNQGNIGPLLQELSKMPTGARLAVSNTSEFVANQDQTRMLAQALSSAPSTLSTSGMAPSGKSPSVSSPITVNAPITINQQPGQSADELAMIVAQKIGEAVADARAASILV